MNAVVPRGALSAELPLSDVPPIDIAAMVRRIRAETEIGEQPATNEVTGYQEGADVSGPEPECALFEIELPEVVVGPIPQPPPPHTTRIVPSEMISQKPQDTFNPNSEGTQMPGDTKANPFAEPGENVLEPNSAGSPTDEELEIPAFLRRQASGVVDLTNADSAPAAQAAADSAPATPPDDITPGAAAAPAAAPDADVDVGAFGHFQRNPDGSITPRKYAKAVPPRKSLRDRLPKWLTFKEIASGIFLLCLVILAGAVAWHFLPQKPVPVASRPSVSSTAVSRDLADRVHKQVELQTEPVATRLTAAEKKIAVMDSEKALMQKEIEAAARKIAAIEAEKANMQRALEALQKEPRPEQIDLNAFDKRLEELNRESRRLTGAGS